MMPPARLVIPEKPDPERDAMAASWRRQGGEVVRLGRFWEPPSWRPEEVRVYGNDTFCLVLQQKLGLRLTAPDDALLFAFEHALERRIARRVLDEASELTYPCFVKPLVPKLFPAGVHEDAASLLAATDGVDRSEAIMVAEVVTFTAEARAFLLAGEVLDCSIYEGEGSIEQARAFAAGLAGDPHLPSTVVMDVGYVKDRGWAIVEFNAAWGAGLNGCDPDRVLPCIAAASGAP